MTCIAQDTDAFLTNVERPICKLLTYNFNLG